MKNRKENIWVLIHIYNEIKIIFKKLILNSGKHFKIVLLLLQINKVFLIVKN